MQRNILAGMSLLGLALLLTVGLWSMRVEQAQAHCQVPCGIYDDPARIARIYEDATTIAKAIKLINELAGRNDALSLNQATRWITTKETHASHVIEVVSQYFLTQKTKQVAPGTEGYESYLKRLADHHAVMVAAMKTKQNPDPAVAEALQHAIDALAKHYQ